MKREDARPSCKRLSTLQAELVGGKEVTDELLVGVGHLESAGNFRYFDSALYVRQLEAAKENGEIVKFFKFSRSRSYLSVFIRRRRKRFRAVRRT